MKQYIHSRRYEALQTLLRELREKAGLRQVDVALKLGCPQSFVSKYESGERRLDLVELESVCNAIGVPLERLIEIYKES